MGLLVNTNMEAIKIHTTLGRTNTRVADSLLRLSSGLRVNSAKDDAAGFATANSFSSKISSMRVASQNATEAQSVLQTADGAYTQIHDILNRMKSLATQAASGQTSDNQMTVHNEFRSLIEEIDRIANSTKYGSTTLVNGSGASTSGITFQIGATNASENQIAISFKGATAACLGLDYRALSQFTYAQEAMDAVDSALTSINTYMGEVGAYQNRLQYTIQNLSIGIENYSASESAIRDVDMATEISTFTKNQILQQSGMAMLSQANQAPQQILSLLKG
ncbi:MAG: flagellin [Syntrophobacter sp.]